MRGFLFESKKVLKKKTILISIFLSFLAAVGLYIFNYAVAEEIHEGNITRLESYPELFTNFVNESRAEKDKAIEAGDTAKAEEMDSFIHRNLESIANYEKMIEAYEQEDWMFLHEKDIDSLQIFVNEPEAATYGIEEQLVSYFTLRATYEELKLLKDINSKPFVQNTTSLPLLATIYDDFTGTSLEQYQITTKRYGQEGFSFLVQLIQLFYIPAVVLIGCFIFGNSIASETTKKKRGLNFYRVLPYSRWKLFFAKYISGYIYLLIFSLLMLAIPLVCSLFTKGLGTLKNPILVYEGTKSTSIFGNSLNPREDQFHFIEFQEYFWKVFIFLIVFSFFIYSIYFLFALLTKNASLSMVLSGAITYIGMNILASEFNPFVYTDIHRIITGEIATRTFNSGFTFNTGLYISLALGIILTILGYLTFRFKRQVT
ncbi:ABC transporter permease [Psychrobacillus sp. MER TA 171]|uniref:ABC transporter permease n=1 Tax=Psychrobacillus sp. MER TA 171 TaxID=2939577 RepID=UPI00203B2609|nr:ABC transporter permease [Psychrobacillus sp. MER TA 171]MCM3357864.1 ABC transporter permease [Psychrobacillus sp. MER TA 171]